MNLLRFSSNIGGNADAARHLSRKHCVWGGGSPCLLTDIVLSRFLNHACHTHHMAGMRLAAAELCSCSTQDFTTEATGAGFVSWFKLRLILKTFQQPNPFCCNRSTTNLFMISFLSRTIDCFFSFWAYGFICGWPRPVSSRSAKQPGWRSPPIVTIVTIEATRAWIFLSSAWDFKF